MANRKQKYDKNSLWVLENKNLQTNSWKTSFCTLSEDKKDIFLITENRHIPASLKTFRGDHSYLKSARPAYKEELYIKPLNAEVNELVSPIALALDGQMKQEIENSTFLTRSRMVEFEQALNKDYVAENELVLEKH